MPYLLRYSILPVIFLFSWWCLGSISAEHVACPDSTIPLPVYHHVTPWGNISAGEYKKEESATTVYDCTVLCCKHEKCNVVFMFNQTCFLISCYTDNLCSPLQRVGSKFDTSYMIRVRSLADQNKDGAYGWEGDDFDKSKLLLDLYAEDEAPRLSNHHSKEDDDTTSGTQTTSTNLSVPTTLLVEKHKTRSCVYGIATHCLEHEECRPKNNRNRVGYCVCLTGYVRSKVTSLCETEHSEEDATQLPVLSKDSDVKSVPPTAGVTSVTTPSVHRLVVSVGGNKVVQLPDDEITLSAFALPKENKEFKYKWTLVSHPEGEEVGLMQYQNTANLKLTKLRAGIYTFNVAVTEDGAFGEANVNVTVLPPKRKNKTPVAIIQPANVTVKLPNKDTVLDGSFSTDDDKIVSYLWEAVTAPLGYQMPQTETPTLQLKDLIPGLYRFKLTVKDSDGVSNCTFANVTVLKEMDYPPTANAGPDVVINLPKNEVILNGNLSTDDKGISSWEWTKSPDTDKPVDMEGTFGPYLHLSHLEVGVYKFVLKVTDTSDQTSMAEVRVFVKQESNSAPVANAGPELHVSLPLEHNMVILNGSNSTDDAGIKRWHWQQIAGPKLSKIENEGKPVAKVSGLIPGDYSFQLTVYDDKEINSSAVVHVVVTQKENLPPHANAGGDKSIVLPCDVVTMNGSASWDDVKVVSYQWTREPSSLVAGDIIENSHHEPILKLTNLIPGRYLFRLTVVDAQGSSNSETASLIVKPPTNLLNQVELVINADMKTFTQQQQDTLIRQLELLLHDGDIMHIQVVKLMAERHTCRVVLIFVVQLSFNAEESELVPGIQVVSRLKRKLRTDSSLLDFQVLSLDTVECQNKCSGHGSCDLYTKRCICEAFWMEDFFRSHFGDQESNCDWSILYVIVICFMVIISVAGTLWSIMCCCTSRRCHRMYSVSRVGKQQNTSFLLRFHKPNKLHKYTLIHDIPDKDIQQTKERAKSQSSSLMVSDSESDETLFETRKVPSSKKTTSFSSPPNGLLRDAHKVRA